MRLRAVDHWGTTHAWVSPGPGRPGCLSFLHVAKHDGRQNGAGVKPPSPHPVISKNSEVSTRRPHRQLPLFQIWNGHSLRMLQNWNLEALFPGNVFDSSVACDHPSVWPENCHDLRGSNGEQHNKSRRFAMKRKPNGRLRLNKETLRTLNEIGLNDIRGGISPFCSGAECSTPTFTCDSCQSCETCHTASCPSIIIAC
jgi:hypothetical protein